MRATRQRWKFRAIVWVGFLNFAAFCVVILTSNRALYLWAFAGLLVMLPAMLCCGLGIKCRVCGELVLVWAIRRGKWINRMEKLTACPSCGARDDSEKLY